MKFIVLFFYIIINLNLYSLENYEPLFFDLESPLLDSEQCYYDYTFANKKIEILQNQINNLIITKALSRIEDGYVIIVDNEEVLIIKEKIKILKNKMNEALDRLQEWSNDKSRCTCEFLGISEIRKSKINEMIEYQLSEDKELIFN